MSDTERMSGARVEIVNPRLVEPDKKKPAPLVRIVHKGEASQTYSKDTPKIPQKTIAEPASNCLMIYVAANSLSAEVTEEGPGNFLQRFYWKHTDLLPTVHRPKRLHRQLIEVTFGENPNVPTTETFGKEDPVVQVEFLGHPDVLVAEIMEAQEQNYVPELISAYPANDSERKGVVWSRQVLMTSPVIHTTLENTEPEPHAHRDRLYQYQGKVMIYLELKERAFEEDDKHEKTHHKVPNSLRIGIGILADADGKLRVYHSNWQDIFSLNNQQQKEVLLQLLGGIYDLSQKSLEGFSLFQLKKWESIALTEEERELLSPDVKRLSQFLSPKEKTHKKKKSKKSSTNSADK